MLHTDEFTYLNTIIGETGRDLPIIQLIRSDGIARIINQFLLSFKASSLLDCRPFNATCKSSLLRAYAFSKFIKSSIDSILQTLTNDDVKRKIKQLSYNEIYNPSDFISFIKSILATPKSSDENIETFTLVVNDPLELVQTMPLFLYTLLTIHYEIGITERRLRIIFSTSAPIPLESGPCEALFTYQISMTLELAIAILESVDKSDYWDLIVDYVTKLSYKWLSNDFDYLLLICKSLHKLFTNAIASNPNFSIDTLLKSLDIHIKSAINNYASRFVQHKFESPGFTVANSQHNFKAGTRVKWLLIGAALASIATKKTWKIIGKMNEARKYKKNSKFDRYELSNGHPFEFAQWLALTMGLIFYCKSSTYNIDFNLLKQCTWIIDHGLVTRVKSEGIIGMSGLHWHNQCGINSLNDQDYRSWMIGERVEKRCDFISPQAMLVLRAPGCVINGICNELNVHLEEFI